MKILFLCDYGINRSVTAARLFDEMFQTFLPELKVKSKGIKLFRSSDKGIANELRQYDKIFCMDHKAKGNLIHRYRVPQYKVINLEIPDNFDKTLPGDLSRLESILKQRFDQYKPYFEAENG